MKINIKHKLRELRWEPVTDDAEYLFCDKVEVGYVDSYLTDNDKRMYYGRCYLFDRNKEMSRNTKEHAKEWVEKEFKKLINQILK